MRFIWFQKYYCDDDGHDDWMTIPIEAESIEIAEKRIAEFIKEAKRLYQEGSRLMKICNKGFSTYYLSQDKKTIIITLDEWFAEDGGIYL